jgi:hypothetical protein
MRDWPFGFGNRRKESADDADFADGEQRELQEALAGEASFAV